MMRRRLTVLGALMLVTLFATQQGNADVGATQTTIRGRLQKTVEAGG